MKFNRNKWWGKHGRFRRQVMVLYGRFRPQVMALYGRVREEDNVLNMSVVFPVNLTIAIVIVHLVIMWGGFDVEVIRNFIFMLAGVWTFYGIIVAARRTKALEKQVHIQEQGQVAERLARAAEQLSSEIMSIRILAILSIGKIAIEADEKICQDIVKVLCAYVREKCPIKGQNKTPSFSYESSMPEDIREIVKRLIDIKTKTNWNIDMDISKINLSGFNLSGADLSGFNLSGANLWRANLWRANLSGANLSGANLLGAHLLEANLLGANLSGADLSDTNLSDADLSITRLSRANLSGADLSVANLSGANLLGARLLGANLSEANLSEANLLAASLSDVEGLDTAENLETVTWPPQEILEEIERREQSD